MFKRNIKIIGWYRPEKISIFWWGEDRPIHFYADEGIPVYGYQISKDMDNGDLMTRGDWLDGVDTGCFMDCDGFGDAVMHNHFKDQYYMIERDYTGDEEKDFFIALYGGIYPSQAENVPTFVTHILWYNK